MTTLPTSDGDTKAIGADASGLTYPSAAASGHVEVALPSLPGSPRTEERLLARDFGVFVSSKIESSINRQPYMRIGPTQSPQQVLRHYVACARGANLMDAGGIRAMEILAEQFAAERDQKPFFEKTVRPWLHGLKPKKR